MAPPNQIQSFTTIIDGQPVTVSSPNAAALASVSNELDQFVHPQAASLLDEFALIQEIQAYEKTHSSDGGVAAYGLSLGLDNSAQMSGTGTFGDNSTANFSGAQLKTFDPNWLAAAGADSNIAVNVTQGKNGNYNIGAVTQTVGGDSVKCGTNGDVYVNGKRVPSKKGQDSTFKQQLNDGSGSVTVNHYKDGAAHVIIHANGAQQGQLLDTNIYSGGGKGTQLSVQGQGGIGLSGTAAGTLTGDPAAMLAGLTAMANNQSMAALLAATAFTGGGTTPVGPTGMPLPGANTGLTPVQALGVLAPGSNGQATPVAASGPPGLYAPNTQTATVAASGPQGGYTPDTQDVPVQPTGPEGGNAPNTDANPVQPFETA
jgi:hypothetical protein